MDWGGDPRAHTPAPGDDGPPRLGPRTSFARWREVVRGRSLPWRTWQVDAAQRLGATVVATLARRSQEQLAIVSDLHDVLGSRAPADRPRTSSCTPTPARRRWVPRRRLVGRPAPAGRPRTSRSCSATSPGTASRPPPRWPRSASACAPTSWPEPRRRQVLERLDALVFHLHPDALVTALVALLDVDTGHLQIARAGAPEPLLAGPEDIRSLPVPGRPPLGVNLGRRRPAARPRPGDRAPAW